MKRVIVIGLLIFSIISGCTLFDELLEPSDIVNILTKTNDTTPPELAVFSPTNNQEVGAFIQYTGSAMDAGYGVKAVYIRLDNTPAISVKVANGSWSTNLPVTNGGKHTNYIYAEDNKGNIGATIIRIVEKKNIPSTVIFYPPYNFLTNVSSILIGGTASVPWPYSISGVKVSVNGGAWSAAGGTDSWSNTINLTEGTNIVYACAEANNGKTNLSAQWKIVRDMTGPTMVISYPSNNQEVGEFFTVNGTVFDTICGVKAVMSKTNNGTFLPAIISGISWSTNIAVLGNGLKTNYIYALDNIGNSSLTQKIIVNRISIPSIIIETPQNGGMTNVSGITIGGIAAVDLPYYITNVQVQLNGGSWIGASGTNSWTKALTLAEGTNNMYARAITANRTNTSAMCKIIKYTLPAIAIISPVNGVTTNNADIVIVGTTGAIPAPYSITKVQVQLNGGVWSNASGVAVWTKSLKLVLGTNTIYARVIADCGKTNTTAVFKIVEQPYSWTKKFGNTGSDNVISSAIDSSGNIYMTGIIYNSVDMEADWGGPDIKNAALSWDAFITKINSDGSYGWSKAIGGSATVLPYGIDIDASGNIYIAGYFYSTTNANFAADWGGTDNKNTVQYGDAFVTKINADGTYGWTKSIGGNNYEYGTSVAVDGSGNIYVMGFFSGSMNFAADWSGSDSISPYNNQDIFITKINANGTYGWTKRSYGTDLESGQSSVVDAFGNLYITGYFSNTINFAYDFGENDSKTTSGMNDAFITKINANGTYGWTKKIGGTKAEKGLFITTDGTGNIYLTGFFNGTVNFAADWGSSDSKTSAGSSDGFLTRINANGSYGWTKVFGGTGIDEGHSLAFDAQGNIYVVGMFSLTVNFAADWSGTDNKSSSAGSSDGFLLKIKSDLSYGWVKIFGGASGDSANTISIDANNGIAYIGGGFKDTVNFGAEWNITDNKSSTNGSYDGFIMRLGVMGW